MENINEELIYWGMSYRSKEDQLKKNQKLTILKFSLLEIQEKVKEVLLSKSNKYKYDNIIEIWTSTKDQENWKLISTHHR